MEQVRRLIYRLGVRPKPGSIWFSPILHYQHLFAEAVKMGSRAITTHNTPWRIEPKTDEGSSD